MTALQRLSLENPVLVGLILLLIALLFRIVDIFVLRLDERLGEIILSKSLGFVLVVLFVWSTGQQLKDIGLHSQLLGQSVFLGVLVTGVALAVGYGIEFVVESQRKADPVLQFAAIDPKAGVSGGMLFALWLLAGNIINSFMEEGLFRGVMLRLFRGSLLFWQANWLQGFLFGAWHLPWVLKGYQTGQLKNAGDVAFSVIANFIPQLILGIVWGYLYLKTNNLWACWISHTLTNSALNFLHLKTAEGLDNSITIRMVTYVVVMAVGMLLVRYLTNVFQMPEVKPWGE